MGAQAEVLDPTSATSIYDFSPQMYGKDRSLAQYKGKVWALETC